MKTLEELKESLKLSPLHIMLLANTGSMTVLLEALFGKISVEAEFQDIVRAKGELAEMLEVDRGEPLAHRVVRLVADRTLVHATSYAPLSRLDDVFRRDLGSRDIPIGKIMAKHSMESRRTILGFDSLEAGTKFSKTFSIPNNSLLLKRRYNIIHKNTPLINITEIFPHEMVNWK